MKTKTQKIVLNLEEINLILGTLSFVACIVTAVLFEIANKEMFFKYIENYIQLSQTLGLIAFIPCLLVLIYALIVNAIENTTNTYNLVNRLSFLLLGIFWAYNTVIYITL